MKNDAIIQPNGEKPAKLPFEVVVHTEHGLVFFPRVLNVNAAGEAQLVLCKAQLLQGLLRRNQAEALQRKSANSFQTISLCTLLFPPLQPPSVTYVILHNQRAMHKLWLLLIW